MTFAFHSRYLAFAILATGCGASSVPVLDPADLIVVGVDPAVEASAQIDGLEGDGYGRVARVDGDGWVSFAMTRSDGASLARVVTSRGVVIAIDETAPLLGHTRGVLDVEPAPPSGTDVDGDGSLDVLLARTESDRRCLLVAHLGENGTAAALALDPEGLPSGVCLESFRDVDGNRTPEAIVRVRAYELARDVVPTVDRPLERDEAGVYRATAPASRFLADERRERDARLMRARATPAPEDAYTIAVELALLSFLADETAEVQLEAFDAAISGVVLDEELVVAVHRARGLIAAGTAF